MLQDQEKAFWEFYNAAKNQDVLDAKTSTMLHLAAAMAVGCYPCMRHYLAQKKLVGMTDDEVHAIEAIVMAVSAGRVLMQHQDATAARPGPAGPDCTGSC